MRREFATQGLHIVNSDIEVANADPGHTNWLPQVQTHAGVRACHQSTCRGGTKTEIRLAGAGGRRD